MSILHQLKKYQQTTPPVVIELSDHCPAIDAISTAIDRIVARSTNNPNQEKHLRTTINRSIFGLTTTPFTGVLYPLEVLIIYHVYFKAGNLIASEEVTDSFLSEFLRNIDATAYRNAFRSAANDVVLKLVACRVAIATYENASRHNKNSLPIDPYRNQACRLLGVSKIKDIANYQDGLQKTASCEQMLFGRIGYLFVWYQQQSPTDSTNLLLT